MNLKIKKDVEIIDTGFNNNVDFNSQNKNIL